MSDYQGKQENLKKRAENTYREEDLYWLWLCSVEHIYNGTIRALLDYFGTPQEVYRARKDLMKHPFLGKGKISEKQFEAIRNANDLSAMQNRLEWMFKRDIFFLTIQHEYYPEKLKEIPDPPYVLFVRGKRKNLAADFDSFRTTTVAMVGARNCTAYGKKIAHDLAFELAARQVRIVSGMAKGIDGESHLGAMDAGGITFAILGCGVDQCYPRENIEIYEEIQQCGAVISEFPPGRQPLAWQFPVRNRLISALSEKIIVVEARENSGSLITVEYGLEQGKDIYAVPGRITDPLSTGCNRLISEGAGAIISTEKIAEILEIGTTESAGEKKRKQKNKKIVLAKELELLYSCVDYFPKGLQELVSETGMEPQEVCRNIVRLQMMELVTEPSKNYYVRI